jgi:hypothetical protein
MFTFDSSGSEAVHVGRMCPFMGGAPPKTAGNLPVLLRQVNFAMEWARSARRGLRCVICVLAASGARLICVTGGGLRNQVYRPNVKCE